MKESIYTIPISEVFEARRGCPVCALRRALEQRWVEYITGAAMMEPDVRQKTNEQGFCARHFEQMLAQRNRLSVALMLQTHLAHLQEKVGARPSRKIKPVRFDSCFVCGMLDRELSRIIENLLVTWQHNKDFQKMYIQQEFVCYPDYERLSAAAHKTLRSKERARFLKDTAALTSWRLDAVKADIDAFCGLYDYRGADQTRPPENIALAIETAISYLTGQINNT